MNKQQYENLNKELKEIKEKIKKLEVELSAGHEYGYGHVGFDQKVRIGEQLNKVNIGDPVKEVNLGDRSYGVGAFTICRQCFEKYNMYQNQNCPHCGAIKV